MKQIPGTTPDPITVAALAMGFGKSLQYSQTGIAPRQGEDTASALVAASAMMDSLVYPAVISGHWEGIFTGTATELGEWIGEHYYQHDAMPDTPACIEKACDLLCNDVHPDGGIEILEKQAKELQLMAEGSGFVMPSHTLLEKEFHTSSQFDEPGQVLQLIRDGKVSDVTPVAIDMRHPGEITSAKRMIWFAVSWEQDGKEEQVLLGHTLPLLDGVSIEKQRELLIEAAASQLWKLTTTPAIKDNDVHAVILELLNDHGGVALDGFGYQKAAEPAADRKVGEPKL